MAGVQARVQCQRSLSDAPSEIPEDAQHMFDADETICCKGFLSCVNRKDSRTYTQLPEVPDEESEIYIDNGNNDRSGYKLEARLSTFEVEDGYQGSDYRRHIFTNVQPFGPAYDMSIKDGDEIVLINEDKFGPGITHDEVLQNFRNIKVDGCSEFKMVIRREMAPGCCGGSDWKWIEYTTTFTIKRELDKHPIIVKSKSHKLKKNRYEMTETSLNRYRVQGTQRFIAINNGQIFTDTLNGDESDMTKGLWKREVVSQGRNNAFRFLVTLCDHTENWYITADRKGRVIPRRNADVFHLIKRGNCVIFQKRGNYLAYDHDNDQLRLQEREYLLDEIALHRRNRKIFERKTRSQNPL